MQQKSGFPDREYFILHQKLMEMNFFNHAVLGVVMPLIRIVNNCKDWGIFSNCYIL